MKKQYLLGVAFAALMIPGAAFAQSTGSIETEGDIVVTGSKTTNGVAGIVVPDSAKAKAVLTQEVISRGAAGNTILNTINLVPGVNFTNSDAYGSSGGNIRIRGFDGNRISLTFDGVPLNDSGNYAIFSNQQLDPEIIDQVNVNLGTTDVDSPTASAAGGTVNYRTRLPGNELGALVSASVGEDDYTRIFGMIDTGEFTSFGTKAFFSASTARNDKFKGPGRIYKQQYNARIYQPIGDNGDFISIAGHYNQNRNNFYRNPSVNDLRTLFANTPALTPAIPVSGLITSDTPLDLGSFSDAQNDRIFGFENLASCTRTSGGPGAQNDSGGPLPNGSAAQLPGGTNNPQNTASCTNFAGVRINPSNTGNIRIQSRFTLADGIILTVDPSFQYVLANGGGFTALRENSALAKGSNINGPGVDFNGDGDFLDNIGFYTPNNTQTRRYGVTASLIWNITPDQLVRVAYTYDRAKHRQTGEWGFLGVNGRPESPFGGRGDATPVLASDGFQLQQRDRESIALLNQVAGQYVGKFFDEALRVELGLRAPFFKRDLDQRCYTQTGGSGFATCTSQPASQLIIVPPTQQGSFPANSLYAPFKAQYKFDKLLPNVGLTYKIGGAASIFASYAKGFSAPRTDNLYRTPVVEIDPETTDAFDLGLRYTTRKVQAQATAWFIGYKNRIVSSFDPLLGISLDRNVGKVDSYGFDASVAFQPFDALTLYALGSYIHTELKSNIQVGTLAAGASCGSSQTAVPAGCAATAGKRVTETPEWQFGGRAQLTLGPVELGIQGKWVDERFATDVNDVVVPGYTKIDLDARFSLAQFGLAKSYVQLNVDNLFDEFYFGNISTQINNGGNPNFSLGSPRTVLGSLVVGF